MAKQKRKWRKKLREIDNLEAKRSGGESLTEEEMHKLRQKHDFRRALAKLDQDHPTV